MTAKTALTVLLLGVLLTTGAIAGGKWPFGPWRRTSDVPILAPQGSGWESAGTFNPAVVEYNGKFVMLYRAPRCSGHVATGLRGKHRRHPLHAPGGTGAVACGGI